MHVVCVLCARVSVLVKTWSLLAVAWSSILQRIRVDKADKFGDSEQSMPYMYGLLCVLENHVYVCRHSSQSGRLDNRVCIVLASCMADRLDCISRGITMIFSNQVQLAVKDKEVC